VGLLIGAVSDNLQQALLLPFFPIFRLFVISGNLAPVKTMPRAIQLLSLGSPLTHYTDIALAIFLKGVGMTTPDTRFHTSWASVVRRLEGRAFDTLSIRAHTSLAATIGSLRSSRGACWCTRTSSTRRTDDATSIAPSPGRVESLRTRERDAERVKLWLIRIQRSE
jgi:hypothetical protein